MNDPYPEQAARRSVYLTERLLSEGMNRRIPLAVLLAALGGIQLVNTPSVHAEHPATRPELSPHRELGRVRWRRDFNAALAESKQSGKPVLILFDEVPGCHTCVSFGETVLSHPLIVEAAEDHFVPVAVFNNVEGADRAVLNSFKEPEWNNPVVRIVSADRSELTARIDGDYSPRGAVLGMKAALEKAGRPVPGYLSLLAEEVGSSREKAVYSMHCFWEGEAQLAGVPGVLATRTGFQGGREVVEVIYDPSRVQRSSLDARAKQMACSREAESGAVKPSTKDDKYQLRGTVYAAVPMTPLQAARLNAAIGSSDEAKRVLSPRQIALAERMSKIESVRRPNFIGREDLAKAWGEAEAVVK